MQTCEFSADVIKCQLDAKHLKESASQIVELNFEQNKQLSPDRNQIDDALESKDDDSVAESEKMFTIPRTQLDSNGTSNSAPNKATTALSPSCPPMQPDYQELLNHCRNLATLFREDSSEKGQRFFAAFVAWQDFIQLASRLVQKLDAFAWQYDLDDSTPGNGYRSFITITNACIKYGADVCRNLSSSRPNLFFRKTFYMKEVEACSQLLSSVCTCLEYLLILHEWSSDSVDLFGIGDHSVEELFERGDTINQYSFYGRCLGFQYGENIRGVLRFISTSMAGFSESFYSKAGDGIIAKTTRSVWTSGKYFLNPELRARRIVNISQNAKVDFCKSFWFLAEAEVVQMLPGIVGSSIKVNRIIQIPAEPLKLPRVAAESQMNQQREATSSKNSSSEFVDIPVPSAHLGAGIPVCVRLLSYTRRIGMIGEGGVGYRRWSRLEPQSPSILFHCHGGGFVAQSSKSHELYLRDWAVALDAPILSVDYSLAPEAPFPRALEEVFYAYCWMIKNAEHLGTTAERIVFAGDSAGANLCIGVALKCIEFGVRIPDGLFLAYCPTLISFVPSPARLLCLMDPLLPFGFMMRCLRAYAAPAPETIARNAKHVDEMAKIRNARGQQYSLDLRHASMQTSISSRCDSNVEIHSKKSRNSSVAVENSNCERTQTEDNRSLTVDDASPDGSCDTFASASYHSQMLERTDLLSTEGDNSLCVSFEDDSQPIVHYPIELNADAKSERKTESEAYIDRFLDQYLIDASSVEAKENQRSKTTNGSVMKDGSSSSCSQRRILRPSAPKTASEENLLVETGKEMIAFETLQNRLNNAVSSISFMLGKYTQSSEICSGDDSSQHKEEEEEGMFDLRKMDALIARSPSVEFAFQVPRDPFLSPYWAPEEWLKQLPPTKILSLDMDPCLDDCVMFAKKLKRLGRPVTLEILKGLPHGFLNFTMLSNEALEGSKHCIKCLQELLKMPNNSIPANK